MSWASLWRALTKSLWIGSLTCLLALLSWAHWCATAGRLRLRDVLAQSTVRRLWQGAVAAFCAGMAATGRAWWEWAVWGIIALLWVAQALLPAHSALGKPGAWLRR